MLLSLEVITERLQSWPGVTSVIQWGDHLVWKVGGKMFSVMSFADEARIDSFSLKVDSPEHWDELTDRDGIEKMSHSTGKNWVTVFQEAGIRQPEALAMLRASYDKVRSGLTKKVQAGLAREEDISA